MFESSCEKRKRETRAPNLPTISWGCNPHQTGCNADGRRTWVIGLSSSSAAWVPSRLYRAWPLRLLAFSTGSPHPFTSCLASGSIRKSYSCILSVVHQIGSTIKARQAFRCFALPPDLPRELWLSYRRVRGDDFDHLYRSTRRQPSSVMYYASFYTMRSNPLPRTYSNLLPRSGWQTVIWVRNV